MNSSGTTIVFSAAASPAISDTFLVDNDRAIMVQVAVGAGVPSGQKLYVYGSIGLENGPSTPVDPDTASSPANPYSALMLRDLNDMDAIVGDEGLTILANSVRLFEINISAVRDVHFVLTGSGAPVTLRMRPYRP